MARRRRVAILFGSGLFAASIQSLLEHEAGLEVVAVPAAGPQAARSIHRLKPHTVIVEEGAAVPLEVYSSIHGQVATIIRLSLEDSVMRISHERQISPADADDLLAAIRSRAPAPRGRRFRHEPQHEGGPDEAWRKVGNG